MRKKLFTILLSILYTTFILIGNSFIMYESFKFIYKHIILNILLFIILIVIFYNLINYIFNKLDKYKKVNKKSNNIFIKYLNKHPFIVSLILIIIAWLPYIISFYPAILSPDPSFQILQYFQIPNKYQSYVVMLSNKQLITNHHPVIHTLLLGTCVKIGTLINNVNLGLFIYTIIQTLILSLTLSYTIKFMNDINISSKYKVVSLLIYMFVPIFPFYALSTVKDVIFGSLIILYIISLYKLINIDKLKLINIIKLIILMILIILFRNNGIHVIILSFPLLLLLKKNKKEKLKYLVIFIVIISFNKTYNNIILPYFKITPTSIREMLSIPFQQTARYVKKHDKEIPNNEKKAIDKLLNYNTLKDRYNYGLADPVKNEYNKYATKEDLKNYFKVWKKELIKDPTVYIEATISNTYGYFYPVKTNWMIYFRYKDIITRKGFDYHYNTLKLSRLILSIYGNIFVYIPIIGLITNIGFNVWILLFMFIYLIYRKEYKYIIYLTPSLVLILVCFASPANTYFRYALPYVFALMTNIAIFSTLIEKKY